ncbi:hypothetical protein ANO14919_027390 [Xylariales sp. No.14919]|nr:hypothetical protein ANO14919_027390 [Xylariales sp. No.14919]
MLVAFAVFGFAFAACAILHPQMWLVQDDDDDMDLQRYEHL